MAPKSSSRTPGDADRPSLPFEPKKSEAKKAEAKRAEGKSAETSKPVQKAELKRSSPGSQSASPQKSGKSTSANRPATGIPEVVSRRMMKRMAVFCGVPTALGMSTFVLSYLAVSQHWFAVPTYAVLFVSLGFFGLGVLGLSYGALSASWEEERLGGWLGWTEFTTNWQRMTSAWKETREAAKKS